MGAVISTPQQILAEAAARGAAKSLAYAGEVTPREAHELQLTAGAHIIDVRSRFEYQYIGRVPGSSLIEWKFWPSGELNPHFLAELQRQCRPDDIVLLLCRSAVRSHAAAVVAAGAGFKRVCNILEGFEGDLDANGQRGRLGGWRLAGLPWVQD
jgi:rhodanese-related sulfurtransferase